MSETRQANFNAKTTEVPSSFEPSKRDYAHYVEDMCAELARLSDRADLPREVSHLLRMAALASHDLARERGSDGTPRGKEAS